MLYKNIECELRFLVKGKKWKEGLKGMQIEQRYISLDPDRTVRVRIYGNKSFLTVKGRRENDMNTEFEWPINLDHAKEMFQNPGLFLGSPVKKIRYTKPERCFEWKGKNLNWSIDEFLDDNYPLQLAEIELNNISNEDELNTLKSIIFDHLPEWIGEYIDTNTDPGGFRYNNIYLASHPFSTWTKKEQSSMLKYLS